MSFDPSFATSSTRPQLTLVKSGISMRRIGPALGGLACLVLATVGTVDPSVPLPFARRALGLAAGLALGTLVAWLLARRRHASVSRDTLFPWLAVGAMIAGLTLTIVTVPIFEHMTFATVTLLRGFLAALGVRFLTDGILGPLPEIPLWGESELFEAAAAEDAESSRRAS